MTFKELSFWGLFKISLIFDFLIPILLVPFLAVYHLVSPEKISYLYEPKIEISGATFDFTSGAMSIGSTAIIALIIGFISLMIQCAVLYFLAQKTPLGCIKIGI